MPRLQCSENQWVGSGNIMLFDLEWDFVYLNIFYIIDAWLWLLQNLSPSSCELFTTKVV